MALHRTGGRSTAAFRRERSEGRNAAADRPPVRCSATRPTPRADPSERTVGGCFKKKKICRGPLRHIGPPLGQSPPSNIRPRSAPSSASAMQTGSCASLGLGRAELQRHKQVDQTKSSDTSESCIVQRRKVNYMTSTDIISESHEAQW